jgi:serine/threonine protein kinase
VIRRAAKRKPAGASKNFSGLVGSFHGDARKLGGGVYAQVFLVSPTPRGMHALAELERRLTNVVAGAPLPAGKPIILKIGAPDHGERWEAFLKRSVRENAAHLAVQQVDRTIVPELYFGGSVGATYVTAMELVEGVTLDTYIKDHGGHISPGMYQRLEHAVTSLLHAGIVHGDLHDQNVMITPTGEVKIIDFGFAVQLSPEQIAEVRKHVHHDPVRAWNHIGGYVNAVQAQRVKGLSWYNPEVKALQVWKSLVVSGAPATPVGVLSPLGSQASSRATTASPTSARRRSGRPRYSLRSTSRSELAGRR